MAFAAMLADTGLEVDRSEFIQCHDSGLFANFAAGFVIISQKYTWNTIRSYLGVLPGVLFGGILENN